MTAALPERRCPGGTSDGTANAMPAPKPPYRERCSELVFGDRANSHNSMREYALPASIRKTERLAIHDVGENASFTAEPKATAGPQSEIRHPGIDRGANPANADGVGRKRGQ
ncbi:MAG: hypothetical protein RLY70_2493 [Planctomycetota bacterium]